MKEVAIDFRKKLRYSDAFGVAAVCGLSVNLSAINKFGNRMPLVSLEYHSFDSLTEASVIEIPQRRIVNNNGIEKRAFFKTAGFSPK